jgi:hypothetical protein
LGSVPWHSALPLLAAVVIAGGVVSTMVKVAVVLLALLQSSVAVKVTVMV